MTKSEFLTELKKKLSGMPEADVKSYTDYYGEMIDDRIEEGLSEEAAVAEVGDPDAIASTIRSTSGVKTEEKPQKESLWSKIKGLKNEPWVIALIVLGCPIWGGILLGVLGVLCGFFGAIIGGIFAVYSVVFACLAGFVGAVIAAVVAFAEISTVWGFLMIASALVLAGLSVLAVLGAIAITKLIFNCIRKLAEMLTRKFKKEAAE